MFPLLFVCIFLSAIFSLFWPNTNGQTSGQCNANFTVSLCNQLGCSGAQLCGSSAGWHNFTSGSITYEYLAFARTGSFYDGSAVCQQNDAKVASIHSEAENRFIATTVAGNLLPKDAASGLWIGIHRFQPQPPGGATNCIWDDGTACDFGNTARANVNIYPWTGGPTGTSSPPCSTQGFCIEDCASVYSSQGEWNDVNCHRSGSGVVCKRQCVPAS